MKSIRLLALLLPLALTVVALSAADSASATVICEAPGYNKECPAKSIYNPSSFEARANSLTLSANGESVTCGSSTMTIEGFNNNPGKSLPLTGTSTISEFPCTGFPSGLSFCGDAEFVGRPYHAELAETTNGKGTLALTEAKSGAPRIIFTNCAPFHQECFYGKGSFHLEWNGAELPSAVRWNEELPLISGSGDCSASIQLSAVYYLVHSGEAFTATTSHLEFLEHGGSERWADCASTMSWSGATSSTLGLSTASCIKRVGEFGEPVCSEAVVKGSPYSTEYSVNGAGDSVTTASNVEFELTKCTFNITCRYKAAKLPLTDHIVEHSNTLKIEKYPLGVTSGIACPEKLDLNATFTSTSPVWALSPIP